MLRETTANDWMIELEGNGAPTRRRRAWAVPLGLGVLLGAVLAAGLDRLPQLDLHALRSAPVASARVWPERELPREWRWERKAITFDHMFRQKR